MLKMKWKAILTLGVFLCSLFIPFSNTSANGINNVMYKFFPKIDDNNIVVSVEPQQNYYDFNVLFKNNQYSNIPWFKQILMELWKRDENKNLVNVENKVIPLDQITNLWNVGEVPKPIEPNITLIRQGIAYKDYIFFNKLAIPYFDNKVLKNNYFDVPYDEVIIRHDEKIVSNPERNIIQVIKKDYQNVTEITFTLSKPTNANKFDGEGFTTYYIDFPTENLPMELKEALINKDNTKMILRDSNYIHDYEFTVKNKYQFGSNYQDDYPTENNVYEVKRIPKTINNQNVFILEWSISNTSLETKRKDFEKINGKFYYFADDGSSSPTTEVISWMVWLCYEKGWKPFSWTNAELDYLLEHFFKQKQARKSYGLFWLRICKKENTLFDNLSIAIKVHKNRFENDKLVLFLWYNKNQVNPHYKNSDSELTTSNDAKFLDNKNNISFVVTPKDIVLFDESSQEYRDKVGVMNRWDMILLNIKDSKISYKKYNPLTQSYGDPIPFTIPELFAENITISHHTANRVSVYAKKEEKQFSFPLDMQKHPFGEYVIKLTTIYDDYYFANFKESNKCFPDLLTTNSWLKNENFFKNWKMIEINIKDILNFNNNFLKHITTNRLFIDTYIYSEKQRLACEEIKKSWPNAPWLIQIINDFKNNIWANSNIDYYEACKYLTNNGKLIKKSWPITNGIDLSDTNSDWKVAKLFSVEVTPNNQVCENGNCQQEMTIDNNIFNWTDVLGKPIRSSFQTKVVYYCNNPDENWVIKQLSHFQIYKYNSLQDAKGMFNFNYNFPVETLRYYWSY